MNLETALDRALYHIGRGEYRETLDLLDQVEPAAPDSLQLIFIKGLALYSNRSLREARRYIERFLAQQPADDGARQLLQAINFEARKPLSIQPASIFDAARIVSAARLGVRQAGDLYYINDVLLFRPFGLLVTAAGDIVAESALDQEANEIAAAMNYFEAREDRVRIIEEPVLSLVNARSALGQLSVPGLGALAVAAEQSGFDGSYVTAAGTVLPGIDQARVISMDPDRDYLLRTAAVHAVDQERLAQIPLARQNKYVLQAPAAARQLWRDIVEQQFSAFAPGCVSEEAVEETQRECTESLRVKIKNNRIVWVNKSQSYVEPTRMRGYLALIEDAAKVYKIPDVDILISQPDWPISWYRQKRADVPVFSFCRTDANNNIMWPFPRFARDDIDFMTGGSNAPRSRWDKWPNWGEVLDLIEEANAQHPWESKKPLGFFAGHVGGRDDTRERFGKLALIYPARLRMIITHFPEEQKHLAQSMLKQLHTEPLPMRVYPQFRYLIHLDGMTTSERLRYLLAMNSVVIKQDSEFYEFYYPLLRPFEHYMPVKADLSDILERMDELDADQKLCFDLMRRARAFAHETLSYANVLLYVRDTLAAYHELQG